MAMTENSRKVLDFLKANYGKKFLTAEVAEGAGVSSPTVTGAVTGMVKKGYAIRTEGTVEVVVTKNGEEVKSEKPVKYIELTEAGLSFDPDAAVESK